MNTSAGPASPLADLGVTSPVLAAPMAGGPTTVALVEAATRAGSLGFLPGGYKSAGQLGEQIAAARHAVPAFGVNLFAPNPVPVDPRAYRAYAEALRPLADRYGVELPPSPVEDDDDWNAKVDLLAAEPVPVVSFTFGIPPRPVIDSLRARGTIVVQTVTNEAEARAAADAGADMLAVQGSEAGGHSGTLTPERMPEPVPLTELIAAVAGTTGLPVAAAGGLATAAQVAAVIRAGAAAAMVGTALLRSPESGASPVHRAAVSDRPGAETVLTRSFTGRPARGIRNAFIDRYDATAPLGYPALHHLTSPLRKAAAAAGEAGAVHLWAGTGYRDAADAPAADILRGLTSAL